MGRVLVASLGFVWCSCGLAESPANMQLIVQVRSEAALVPHGASVLVKVRLAPATQVKIWRQDSCDSLPTTGHVMADSGVYEIPLGDLGDGTTLCLASTDNGLRISAPVK